MTMFHNLKAPLLSNHFLLLLDSLIMKLLHTPAVRANQVIMVFAIVQLIQRPAGLKINLL